MSEENIIKKGLKKFGLTTLAVDNATSIFILTFMVIVFGVSSYTSIPKEAYPEINFPQIFVNTVYFGNSAEDIESLITRPIEKELGSVAEIKKVTSSSMQDYSMIVAEFNSDVEFDDAVRKMKDAVDKAKNELPTDLDRDPEVIEVNMADAPIMSVNVSGNYSNEQLREYAEYLEDRFEDLKEVSKVDMKGVMEREVQIEVDLQKMQALKVSYSDVAQAIGQENMTMSGGEILSDEFRRNIRIVGQFEDPAEISDVIVKSERQRPIYMRDFSTVTYGFQDRTSIARADLLPVISLDVIKKRGENVITAASKIKEIIAASEGTALPEDLSITLFNDMSIQTESLNSNLENSIISGVILVVLVLLFFLGLRNAMFVGAAIPLSMLIGFVVLQAIGYSMNMMVLFSLILALGMLVDNAIVVVENIYRYMQEGYSGPDAAKYGTGEVAVPIIASTATTLAAFVPLAFWPGIMGSFMRYLPITLIIVLSCSLFVALVINPVLTSALMKVDEKADDAAARKRKTRNNLIGVLVMILLAVAAHFGGVMWLRNILVFSAAISFLNHFLLRPGSFIFQNKVLPILERGYDKFIRFALKGVMPYLIFIGTIGLLISSFALMGVFPPKVVLFPDPPPNYINAFVELPMGKDIEATNRIMKDLEAQVVKIIEPHRDVVDAVLAQIGENTSDPNAGPDFTASPQKARLTVTFVKAEDRNGKDTWAIMDEIRQGLKGVPGVKMVLAKDAAGPPTGNPINIEIQGEDVTTLANLSEDVINHINAQNIGGIEELKKDINLGKPEMIIDIDREAARRFEISTFAIADAVRTSVFGKEISKFKDGDDDHPIVIRANSDYRYNIDQVLNQMITFRSMASGQIVQVPISALVKKRYTSTFDAIKRKDQERMVTVFSNVVEGYNPNEIILGIQSALDDYDFPEGYTYEFTGEQQEQQENMAFLGSALLIALFAILLILVAQFNSVSAPVIILLSVIFSTIGVLYGYVMTGRDIEIVMTGVGIISLAGIVVNNAIVLIDYIKLTIARKSEELSLAGRKGMDFAQIKEAIVYGGATRLRPVLLTAITTVLGLIPLATGFNINFSTLITDLEPNIYFGGDNAAFFGTMAWTVIYGLIFATFLTLIVVPVMFWLSVRLKRGLGNLVGKKKVQTT